MQNTSIGLKQHLIFIELNVMFFMALYAILRLALFIYNIEFLGDATYKDVIEAFLNGIRFDLKATSFVMIPIVIVLLNSRWLQIRSWQIKYLSCMAVIVIFLGVVELDYYAEFQQRLNSLAIKYAMEDPITVISMVWYGFPVVKILVLVALASVLSYGCINIFHKLTSTNNLTYLNVNTNTDIKYNLFAFCICIVITIACVRGTFRQGRPLSWGDAFTTNYAFTNYLGLNGNITLVDAIRALFTSRQNNIWLTVIEQDKALETTRKALLLPTDILLDTDTGDSKKIYPMRRISIPKAGTQLPIKNVVTVLMESFAGQYTGALGGYSASGVTPYFDKLAKEGLLFTRFFSNGTQTHQGMYTSMTCIPSLPGLELLMQIPEGDKNFAGLPWLLKERGFNNSYIYNGDFMWDNQRGFFGKQGITNFIGRNDFKNPKFRDPTWGVSDEDVFDRSLIELNKMHESNEPFYVLIQTLSNHLPYALPEQLPIEPVKSNKNNSTDDLHLTTMKYADYALGTFFEKVKQQPYYKDTLFVLVGDHGFTIDALVTENNLMRHWVPMLLIAPGLEPGFNNTIASHVDIVPTVMGRFGEEYKNHCYGRDLLSLPESDTGFAIINTGGDDPLVTKIINNSFIIRSKTNNIYAYKFSFDHDIDVSKNNDITKEQINKEVDDMLSIIQTATKALLEYRLGL